MISVSTILQSSNYQSQLQDERWKRFSSSIRRSRGNFCESCKRGNIQTQVHHIFYEPTLKLWEHREEDLIVLCRACHQGLHEQLKIFRRAIFRFLQPRHFEVLNEALAIGLTAHNALEFVHAIREMALSPGSIKRFAGWSATATTDTYNATEREYKG